MPEYSNYLEGLDPVVGALSGDEIIGVSKNGNAVSITTQQIIDSGAGITSESERAFSAELLFDKNQIEGTLHTQTADITFTVSESGNIDTGWSVYGQRIVLDGVNPVYFEGFNHVANIASGDILEAGTYQFIFWYSNGIARASIMLPRQETVLLTPLIAPTDFEMVAGTDPETEIDATWTAVPNATSIELELSSTGGSGPWTLPITLAGSATSYTRTGLTPNTTYHQRLRALGDLTTFSNSGYVIDALTTQDAGDVTAPTFESVPADSAIDVPINKVVIITANEALVDSDGVTEITNANIASYITAVNSTAGAQAFTATIDITKKIITITPNVVWDELDDITITLDGVEDANGNDPAAFAITFTTSDYTVMEGNHLSLGSQVDSVVTGNDINFELEAEFKDIVLSGTRGIIQKYIQTGLEISFIWATVDDSVIFKFYLRISGSSFSSREIIWADALLGFTEGKLTLKYFGAIDTNDGLDRAELYIDDVLVSAGKSVVAFGGSPWPFAISASTAPLELRGPSFREAKNFIIRNNMGATTIVNIPLIRVGTDTSGNSFDGTWI